MQQNGLQHDAELSPRTEAPSSVRGRLKLVGPGLVVAATGVGAGDLIASLVVGTRFGLTLIWALIIGALVKFLVTEGVGRWYMASGQTMVQGWHSLGRLASGYFVVYMFLLTFVYSAAVTSASALAATAMFPILPLPVWAILHGVAGFILVGIGRYDFFERIMEFFVGLMFITIVGLAIFLLPDLGEVNTGLLPQLPEGSLLYALGLIGGVGATLSLAAYPYWARERGWRGASWIPMMRLDLAVAYVMTAIFMLAMLVIGTVFLFGTGTSISGEEGLVTLSGPLGERFGVVARWLFLIGFWAATTSSIIGAWNSYGYLFADYVRTVRRVQDAEAESYLSEKSRFFRGMLVWVTFPPMLLHFLGQPVFLVIVYAALGAFFMPFLAITLLWLLNSRRVAPEHRNRIATNIALGGIVLLFAVLAVQELVGLF